ncbi:oxidoreductase [Secundilactobacillus paracollinoides]|uniref:SDR family NAD(P)-dependent oxidoreductase n=1 Tax=Secundilactobacillus paracollinoides TaxID=240427 RepID=UPI00081A9D1D|nr:SDR family NAD(P)-dependent oxidoreductase [Secundilactobacillus paracollinoides]ANZ63748.1 oxidoreductase [Secundilactobacillus paracollinoides]
MKTPQQPINSPFTMKATSKQVMRGINLTGKTTIVTGGYSDIGLKVTEALVKAGAHVIVPARTLEKAQTAAGHLPNVEFGVLDLMDPASIDTFAAQFLAQHHQLDLLIECAGIMFAPLRRDSRGNESQFSTNYLGHFQLTAKLYPALKAAGTSRVIVVTSRAQSWNGTDFQDPNFDHRDYDSHVAYAQSKAADILFAVELDKRAQKDGVRAFAVHPGLVPGTGLGRFVNSNTHLQHAMGIVMNNLQATRLISTRNAMKAHRYGLTEYDYFKTVSQGAADILWAATSPLLRDKGGVFVEDSNIGTAVSAESTSKFGARPWSIDPQLAAKLWSLGEQYSGTKFSL